MSEGYLFVDAGYLNECLSRWGKNIIQAGQPIAIQYESLFKDFDRVFYYDAVPQDQDRKHDNDQSDSSERKNKIKALNRIGELNDTHVYTGVVKGAGKKRRQKQVDVMLAVHALQHATRKNTNRITILAGDEDFKPLVDALVMEGMPVTIWHDPFTSSNDFVNSADRRRILTPWYSWRHLATKEFRQEFQLPQNSTGFETPNYKFKSEPAPDVAFYRLVKPVDYDLSDYLIRHKKNTHNTGNEQFYPEGPYKLKAADITILMKCFRPQVEFQLDEWTQGTPAQFIFKTGR